MLVSAEYARNYLAEIEEKFGRDYGWGANVVGDNDEDYVFDALFDVPNI